MGMHSIHMHVYTILHSLCSCTSRLYIPYTDILYSYCIYIHINSTPNCGPDARSCGHSALPPPHTQGHQTGKRV